MFAELIATGIDEPPPIPRCSPYGNTPNPGYCSTGINPSWGICRDGLIS